MGAPAFASDVLGVRYFFDINDGADVKDEVGRVLDPLALRYEALRVISRLASAEAEDTKETVLVLTARDDAGRVHLKVRTVCQVEEF